MCMRLRKKKITVDIMQSGTEKYFKICLTLEYIRFFMGILFNNKVTNCLDLFAIKLYGRGENKYKH